MKNILTSFDGIGDILLDIKEEGDSASAIELEDMSFNVIKASSGKLNGTTLNSTLGSVVLSKAVSSDEASCLGGTVSQSLMGFNPVICHLLLGTILLN